ncbi:TlpA family protein disulfide reductase [uncultured Amnibacterium sp.]|uniref:TlpA family protein disulfide reductase n=1 Tax=uncultured Amnibacterium sp. TaxID=1631851 RepID=UPI0035CA0481
MLLALLVVVALVVVTAVIGVVWRARTGAVRRVDGGSTDLVALGLDAPPGERVSLVQLSTTMCAACRPTARLLQDVARTVPGAVHVEILLDEHPHIADRFAVLQTPTTLLLDAGGVVRARLAGAPRRADLEAAVADIVKESNVRAH